MCSAKPAYHIEAHKNHRGKLPASLMQSYLTWSWWVFIAPANSLRLYQFRNLRKIKFRTSQAKVKLTLKLLVSDEKTALTCSFPEANLPTLSDTHDPYQQKRLSKPLLKNITNENNNNNKKIKNEIYIHKLAGLLFNLCMYLFPHKTLNQIITLYS